MVVFENLSKLRPPVRVLSLPGVECCLALWVGRAPEPEPLRERSRQIEAALDASTRVGLQALDRSEREWPLRALSWFYSAGAEDFEACLAQFRRRGRVAADASANGRGRARKSGPAAGKAVTRGGGSVPAVAPPAASVPRDQAIDDVLHAIWHQQFARIWELQRATQRELEARLRERVALAPSALATLSARALFDPESDRLVFAGGHAAQTFDCEALDGIDLVPSLWLRKRVVVVASHRRVAIALGAGAPARVLSSAEMAALMGVLAHPRRIEILRACTTRPQATQELAAQLGITEGPVSRHLKELEQHGLVTAQRCGRYVKYTAVPETIAVLARQLDRLPHDVILGSRARSVA